MKVRELIKTLSEFPLDQEVLIGQPEHDIASQVNQVKSVIVESCETQRRKGAIIILTPEYGCGEKFVF